MRRRRQDPQHWIDRSADRVLRGSKNADAFARFVINLFAYTLLKMNRFSCLLLVVALCSTRTVQAQEPVTVTVQVAQVCRELGTDQCMSIYFSMMNEYCKGR